MRRERKTSGSELSLTRRTMFLAAAVAGAVTWGASQAQATDGTWNADASANWSDTTKWLNNIVAGGTDAVANFNAFDITALRTVTLDTAVTVGTLNLGDLTNNNNNWVFVPVGTNTLTLQTSVSPYPVISVITGRTGTISAFLAGTQGFHSTGPGTLVIGNTASASAGGTLSGTVSIDAGTLQINNPATLGTVSAIGLNAAGVLQLRSDIPATWAQNINILDGTNPTINADRISTLGGTLGTTQTVSGTLAFVGSSATAVTFSSGNNQLLAFSQPVSLPGAVNLTVSGGTAVLSQLTGAGTFTKLGAGTLMLGATSGTISGSTITTAPTVAAGTLAINSPAALGSSITAFNLTGGTLSLRADTPTSWNPTLNVLGGSPVLDANRISAAGINGTTQTFAGTINMGTANTMGFGSTNNQILFVSNALSLPGTISLSSVGGTPILSSLTGPGTFIKTGSGTLSIGATAGTFTASTITGTVSVLAGTLALDTPAALPSSNITAYDLTGAGTLSLRNDAPSSWGANINVLVNNGSINADRISATGNGFTQTVTGTVLLGSNASSVQFSSGNAQLLAIATPINLRAGTMTLSATGGAAQLSSLTGPGQFIKAGGGILALGDPANVVRSTISGTASVTAGTLTINTAQAMGSLSSITVASGATLLVNSAASNMSSLSANILTGGTIGLANNGSTPWTQGGTPLNFTLPANGTFLLTSDRSATFYQNLAITNNVTLKTQRYITTGNNNNNQWLTLGGLNTIGSNTVSFAAGNTYNLVLASPITLTGSASFNVGSTVYMGPLSGPGTFTRTGTGTLALMGANTLASPLVANLGTTVLDWRANKSQAFTSYTVSSGSNAATSGTLIIYPQSLPDGTTIKLSGTISGSNATLNFGDPFRYTSYNVNLRVEGTANTFNTGPTMPTAQRQGTWRGNPNWGRATNFGALTLGTASGFTPGLTLTGNGGVYFTGTTLEANATITGNTSRSSHVASVVDLGILNAAGKTLTLTGTPGRYQISTPNAWQNVASVLAQAPVAVTAANAKLAAVDFTNASSALYLYADQDTTAGATLPATPINSTLALYANVGSHYNGLQLANYATVTNGFGTLLTTSSVEGGAVAGTVAAPLTYASNLVLNGAVNVNGGAGLTLAGNLTGDTGSLVVKSGLVILSGNNSNLGGDATTYDGVVLSGGNVRIANALAMPKFGSLVDYLEIKTAGNAVGLAYDPAVAGGIPTTILAPTLTGLGQAVFAIDTTAWTTNINPTVVNASVPCTTNFSIGSTGIGKTTGAITPGTNSYYLGGGGGTLELAMQNVLTGTNNVYIGANGTIKLSNANNSTGTITLAATGNLVLGHVNAIQNATLALSLSGIDTKGQVASTSGALLVDPTAGNVTGNITRNGGPIGFTADKTLSSYSDLPGAWGTTVVSAVANSSGTPTDVVNFGGTAAAGTTTFNFAAGDHGSNPVAFYLNAPNGTVKFTQANTYSGGTVLAGGTLEISAPNQLPGKLVFAGTTANSPRLHATQTMTLNNPLDATALTNGGANPHILVDDGKILTLAGTVTADTFGNTPWAMTYGLTKEGLGTVVYSPSNGTTSASNAGFIVAGGVLETAFLPYVHPLFYGYPPQGYANVPTGPGLRFTPNGGIATFRFTGTATTGWNPAMGGAATNSGFNSSIIVDNGMGIVNVTDPAGILRVWGSGGPLITLNDGANFVKTGPGTLSLNSVGFYQWDSIFPFTGASVDVQQGTMAFNDVPTPYYLDIGSANPLMNPDAQITYKVQNGATLQVYRYTSDLTDGQSRLAPVSIAGNFLLNDEYDFQGGGTPEAKVAGIYLTNTGATTIKGTWRVIAGSASLPVNAEADTVWERRAGAVVTLGTGANLIIDAGATFEANGTADPFTDTITSSRHLPITNNGALNITWGDKAPGAITGTGSLVVGSSSTLTADSITQGNLVIAPDSKVSIRSNGSNTSFLGTIQVAGGILDLANNDMLVASGGAAQEHGVSAHLLALAAPTGSSLIKTTGVMTGATYTALVGPTFHGQSVGADALVLKYTVAGDTNFDGTISMDDYLATDAGYLMGGSNWVNGDFNHDGLVNAKDYALIDFNNAILHPGSGATMEALHTNWFGADYTAALTDLTSAVPEPASLLLLGAGLTCLLRRRR